MSVKVNLERSPKKEKISQFKPIMADYLLKKCLSGVILVIFALISDNGVRTDVNFKSKPTTVKTFENDSVLLPCYSTGTTK